LLEPLASDGMFQHFRPLYQGHLIANVDMTQELLEWCEEAATSVCLVNASPSMRTFAVHAPEKGQIKRRAEVQHSLLASGRTFAVCSTDPTTTA
jgi:hypothetical protein